MPAYHGSTPSSSIPRHRGSRRPCTSSNPTPPVLLSSLRALTATSSAYNPPSPPFPLLPSSSTSSPTSSSSSSSSSSSHPPSPIRTVSDHLNALSLSTSSSQPIPIPKPASTAASRDHLPITPLTGRFEKGCYFASQLNQSPPEEREPPSSHKNYNRHRCRRRNRPRLHHHHHHHNNNKNNNNMSRMRPDSSNFYSPVVSSTMPSSSASSQPSQSRSQNTKSIPSFHLGNLPRFYPTGNSQNTVGQHTYRRSSGSSRGDGVTGPRTTSGQHSPSPSAPRLDPLNSPGPVTPLVLEETGSYLTSGIASNSGNPSSREPPNLNAVSEPVERLIAREAEQSRQRSSKTSTKGR